MTAHLFTCNFLSFRCRCIYEFGGRVSTCGCTDSNCKHNISMHIICNMLSYKYAKENSSVNSNIIISSLFITASNWLKFGDKLINRIKRPVRKQSCMTNKKSLKNCCKLLMPNFNHKDIWHWFLNSSNVSFCEYCE